MADIRVYDRDQNLLSSITVSGFGGGSVAYKPSEKTLYHTDGSFIDIIDVTTLTVTSTIAHPAGMGAKIAHNPIDDNIYAWGDVANEIGIFDTVLQTYTATCSPTPRNYDDIFFDEAGQLYGLIGNFPDIEVYTIDETLCTDALVHTYVGVVTGLPVSGAYDDILQTFIYQSNNDVSVADPFDPLVDYDFNDDIFNGYSDIETAVAQTQFRRCTDRNGNVTDTNLAGDTPYVPTGTVEAC